MARPIRMMLSLLLVIMFVALSNSNLVDPSHLGVVCDYCVPEKTYLDFSSIQPSGFDNVNSATLKWGKKFPDVRVSVEGEGNPMIMGQTHMFKELLSNPKFFNITGKQDIKSLMHYSCGTTESKITYEFIGGSSMDFLFVLYGVTSDSSVVIDAFDAYGYPINMLNWKTLDHGILSSSDAMHPPTIKMTPSQTTLNLTWSNVGANSYVVMQPNQLVSKIVVTVKGIYCDVPCKGLLLYYSLIGIGDCEAPQNYAIGSMAFLDSNGDGIRQSDEPFYPGIQVDLIKNGQVIATTTTNANGNYIFDNLPNGTYSVQFHIPDGSTVSPPGKDSVPDQTGLSPPIVLSPETTTPAPNTVNATLWNPNINVGIVPETYKIAGKVCNDPNGNGAADQGEGYLQGITVNLLDVNGGVIKSTTTDSTGSYSFDKIKAGTYGVQFVLPSGYMYTQGTSSQIGANGIIVVNVNKQTAGATKTIPANACMRKILYALGDFVFADVNNDGLYTAGTDRPFEGITVNIYDQSGVLKGTTKTDANGKYIFDNLDAGTYNVQFVVPDGWGVSPKTSQSVPGPDGRANNIVVGPSTTTQNTDPNVKAPFSRLDIDAGLVQRLFAIGNVVWVDSNRNSIMDQNEVGLPNVTVQLLSPTGTVLATTTTDINGRYYFDRIPAGTNYQVVFTPPGSGQYIFSPQQQQSRPNQNGQVTGISLTPTTPGLMSPPPAELGLTAYYLDPTINAGVIPVTYALGDTVWVDTNANGIRDPSEPLFSNVYVQLTDSNGNVVGLVVTDQNGNYLFDNLPPGNYCVAFRNPTGYGFSPKTSQSVGDANGRYCFDITKGASPSTPADNVNAIYINNNVDQGMTPPLFAVGDFVFYDNNRDGLVNGNDSPAPGITVTLFNQAGLQIKSAVTDSQGRYLFDGLQMGTYSIVFSQPAGFTFSPITAQSKPGSDGRVVFTLQSNAPNVVRNNNTSINAFYIDSTIDAGLMRPQFAIGYYAFLDMNSDGVRQSNERGIQGITVQLTDNNGNMLNQTVTDINGIYHFDNLPEGDYCTQFVIPSGYGVSPVGTDSKIDANGKFCFRVDNTTSTLSTPSDNVQAYWIYKNANGGLTPPTYAIGDRVWQDDNRDGKLDASEKPLANITVQLFQGSTKVAETTSDANGIYHFDNLIPGTYQVVFSKPTENWKFSPQGQESTPNSLGQSTVSLNPSNTKINNVTSADGPLRATYIDRTIDAGIMPPLFNLGTLVFENPPGDGFIRPNDTGVPNVPVILTTPNGTVIANTTTTPTGTWNIPNVPPGDYCLQVNKPDSYQYAPTTSDSVVDATGKYCFTLTPSDPITNKTFNTGLVPNTYGVTGNIFSDVDRSNTKTPTDTPVGNLTVNLVDSTGKIVQTTTTTPDGSYSFDNVPGGKYTVEIPKIPDYHTWLVNSPDSLFTDGKTPIDLSPSNPNVIRNPTPDNPLSAIFVLPNINGGINPPKFDVGTYVFNDPNGDGKKDPTEPGIPNVVVTITTPNGTVVTTTTTDPEGKYKVPDLEPGEYCAQITMPEGTTYTTPGGNKQCFTLDLNNPKVVNGTDGTPILPTIDFGTKSPLYSIGDYVFIDSNRDGQPDSPFPGMTVNLLDSTGAQIATTTTDANGAYHFDNLVPGSYQVQFVKPKEYEFIPTSSLSKPTDQTGNVPVTLSPTSTNVRPSTSTDGVQAYFIDPTIDAGLRKILIDVGTYVFVDTNKDGKKDPTEPGIPNVVVTITTPNGTVVTTTPTDPEGKYKVPDLEPGEYCAEISMPAGTSYTTPGGNKQCFTLDLTNPKVVNGTDGTPILPTIDFGTNPALYAIGDYVFIDSNRDGQPDAPFPTMTVNLLDSTGAQIATTTTDSNGAYHFDNLPAGSYQVQFVKPKEYEFIPTSSLSKPADQSGMVNVNLSPSNTNIRPSTSTDGVQAYFIDPTIDAGLRKILIDVGTYVFNDPNGDGKKDPTEPGIPNVVVTITTPNGTVVTTTPTDPEGKYNVPDLEPGEYCAQISMPEGTTYTTPGGNKQCFTLDLNNPKVVNGTDGTPILPTIDFGTKAPLYAIGDYVFIDTNRDGQPDAPFPGVNVTLSDDKGTMITSTLTDANGAYHFDNLMPGNYTVTFNRPKNYEFIDPSTLSSPIDQSGVVVVNLANGNPDVRPSTNQDGVQAYFIDSTVDAGLRKILIDVGTYVFIDTNKDGKKDPNEPGVQGVNVTVTTPNGTVITTTTTDTDGKYKVPDLEPGEYCVQISMPEGTTYTTEGGNKQCFTLDLNNPKVVNGTDGTPILPTIDFGTTSPLYSIGDYVFIDSNRDGQPDAPFPGMNVSLHTPGGDMISSTTTDANGAYHFDNLVPGSYVVKFNKPNNYEFIEPSSLSTPVDQTGMVTVDLTRNNPDVRPSTAQDGVQAYFIDSTIDAGLRKILIDVGTYVFVDTNKDGKKDPTEPGIPNVVVTITTPNGTVVTTTPTDSEGKYKVPDLEPGEYCAEISMPAGTSYTTPGGNKQCFTLDLTNPKVVNGTDGTPILPTIDFGTNPPLYSIGDYVFIDSNRDGQPDAPFPGMTVNLLDSTGAQIATTTTDANGAYHFDNLVPGSYQVQFVKPKEYEFIPASSLSKPTDQTGNVPVTLSPTSTNVRPSTSTDGVQAYYIDPTIDAGLRKILIDVGTYVFVDTNKDGKKDPTEPGIPNVVVTITTPNGTVVTTTPTDPEGKYNVPDLEPGEYCAQITMPAGTTYTTPGGNKQCFTLDLNNPKVVNGTDGPILPTIDFGTNAPLYSIGDYVFIDSNRDGQPDSPFSGMTVNLLDSTGAQIATTTTDANGAYHFDNLLPGSYQVQFVKPKEYEFIPTSSLSKPTDQTGNVPVTLSPTSTNVRPSTSTDGVQAYFIDPTIDAGLRKILIDVGTYVFVDTNKDGKKDPTEPGIPNVVVTITTPNGTVVTTTPTDPEGKYNVPDLEPGEYCAQISMPEGTTYTTPGGNKQCFTLDLNNPKVVNGTNGPILPTIDFGTNPPLYSIGDYVFIDSNRDGQPDAPFPTMTVNLLDSTGAQIATTTTDANGAYHFDNLPTGTYQVKFVNDPSKWVFIEPSSLSKPADQSGMVNVNLSPSNTNIRTSTSTDGVQAYFIDPTIDAGLRKILFDIGTNIFVDPFNNGTSDPRLPPPLTNLTLTYPNGSVITTTTTTPTGEYNITDIPPGDYCIQMTPIPSTYSVSPQQNMNVFDANGKYCFTLTPTPGKCDTPSHCTEPGIDGGIVPTYSITGNGWNDLNEDNVRNPTDTPVGGVVVELKPDNGQPSLTTTTDPNGNYNFTNIPAGGYTIIVHKPNGSDLVPQSTDSIFPPATGTVHVDVNPQTSQPGTTTTYVIPKQDFGLVQPTYGVGDFVYQDTNKNGQPDAGEPGLPGVSVGLVSSTGEVIKTDVTDQDGKYSFDKVPAGNYCVNFDVSPDVIPVNPPNKQICFTLDKTHTGMVPNQGNPDFTSPWLLLTVDQGVTTKTFCIDSQVWLDNGNGIHDSNEGPLANITVELYQGDKLITTMVTNSEGRFKFMRLPPGSYALHYVLPGGLLYSPATTESRANENGWFNFTLNPANPDALEINDPEYDCNYVIPNYDTGLTEARYAIGNFAFVDLNSNGMRDANEKLLPGVKITLTDQNGNTYNTTTDQNGKYIIDNLRPLDYCAQFAAPSSQYAITTQGVDSRPNATGQYCFTLKYNADGVRNSTASDGVAATFIRPDINVGYAPMIYNIGSYVWYDNNKDGIRDPTEKPASNVTVRLINADGSVPRDINGNIVEPIVTGANGTYLFTNIPGGVNYQVQFTQSPNEEQGTQWTILGTDNKADSQGRVQVLQSTFTKVPGTINTYQSLANNGGLVHPCYIVGNKVFSDGNTNGRLDTNEIGFANVTMTLFNENGTIARDMNGVPIAPVVSDANGNYQFTGVPTGKYYVQAAIPSRYVLSPVVAGGNQFSMVNGTARTPVFSLTPTSTGITNTPGTNPRCSYSNNNQILGLITPTMAIGDFAFIDANKNGLQDSNELPLAGVKVELLLSNGQPYTVNGVPVTTTTNANGFYYFDNLPTNMYTVRFTPPTGYSVSPVKGDNKVNPTGVTDAFNLTINSPDVVPRTTQPINSTYINPTIDAGFYLSVLGVDGYVWKDIGGDGLFDPSSVPTGNITVSLVSSNGTVIASVKPDQSGYYSFPNVIPGSYKVVYNIDGNTDWLPTKQNAGARNVSSQMTTTYESPTFNLDNTNTNLHPCPFAVYNCLQMNAGVKRPDNTTVQGKVFKDYNCNSKMDAGTAATAADVPLQGVPVYLFGANSTTPIAQTTTAADGTYKFSNLTFGEQYIISVGTPALPTSSSRPVQNCNSGDRIVPPTGPPTDPGAFDFSFITDEDYCQDTPNLATSCFVRGLFDGTNKDSHVVVQYPYDANRTSQTTPIVNYSDVGAINGLAYDRSKDVLYAGAFMKFSTTYGPLGSGGIYKMNSNGSAIQPWISINDIYNDPSYCGEPFIGDETVATEDLRFEQVYKSGLGDMDIDTDRRTIGTICLGKNEFHVLPIDQTPTRANSRRFALPNLCGTSGLSLGFAVSYHLGKYYIGITCTADVTNSTNDLVGHVITFDPVTNAFSQPVLSIPFNYSRGCKNTDSASSTGQSICNSAVWNPWIDDTRTQPMLVSITFDGNNMITSIRDRGGDMGNIASGDILIACMDATGKFVLERDGNCGSLVGAHHGPTGSNNRTEGPGTGEFFNDNFSLGQYNHDESVGNAATMVPGYPTVAANGYDLTRLYEGATKFFNTKNGSMMRGHSLYISSQRPDAVTFGKTNGLGDIVAFCRAKPTKIGDRVWNDTNGNGLQDPFEPGLAGVTVTLTSDKGYSKTVITDANGQYLFTDVPPYASYTLTASGIRSTVVPANRPPFSNKASDVSGVSTITFTLGDPMQNNNNFDYDFGAKP